MKSIYCYSLACLTAGVTASSSAQIVQADLDADRNGLYDDRERKALLDELVRLSPDLRGPFDHDGDGMVSVSEQTRGRHPLSQIIAAESVIESGRKVPWAIDIFPEWISTAYLQEDVAAGPVSEHKSRGTVEANATAASTGQQPVRQPDRGGIAFAENSGQTLTMPGQRDACWNYRWCVLTFRIDGDSGRDESTVLLDLNRGKGSLRSSPKVWFDRSSGLNVQFVGLNQGGLDQRIMSTRDVVADGESWNVLVCGIRYGQMYASLNGVPLSTDRPQPPRFSGERPTKTTSHLGDESSGNVAWAYDALVFGLTEPSEAMVRKMTGWAAHRLGFADRLPGDHPYRDAVPVLDAEDFPDRYLHDDRLWTAWGESLEDRDAVRRNAGGKRMEPRGFERVFFDDFRADRVALSTSGEGDLWVGPGFNSAVGGSAPLVPPGKQPDAYLYHAGRDHQYLSLAPQGNKFRGSAFYSINDMGHGYTWDGPKVFRIRCMFPEAEQKDLAGGLFPAFWSYGPEFLFWRTANRIENDWFEFDGQNGYWYNGIASHVHYVHLKSEFPLRTERYKSYKVYGGELNEAKGKIPGGFFIWDGQFHTWEFVVDDNWTVVNVTIPDGHGGERWVEVCRAPTPPSYLERLDLQLDYALKGKHGEPKPGERQDFIVDWVEVLQKTRQIEETPEPFTARPELSGGNGAGDVVTCEPNLPGISDVRYYWFADGYPLTWGPDDQIRLGPAEAGKSIRCMVKAVGALNMPEAWSDVIE